MLMTTREMTFYGVGLNFFFLERRILSAHHVLKKVLLLYITSRFHSFTGLVVVAGPLRIL